MGDGHQITISGECCRMTEKADDDVLREALWLLSMIFCTCVASCYFIGAGYTSLILLVFCAYKYFKHRM